MYCMNCGQELPAGAKFCFNCGSKVEAVKIDKGESNGNGAVKGIKQKAKSNYDMPVDIISSASSDLKNKAKKEIIPEKKEESSLKNNMPCHRTYYNFGGVRDLRPGWANKESISSCCAQSLVWEEKGYLYYGRNGVGDFEFHKIPLSDNSGDITIAKFNRKSKCFLDRARNENDTFKLGAIARFCVNNGKIYFSRPQIEGRAIDNNEIWSIDLSNPADIKKEFELIDTKREYTLYSPYVIDDRVLVNIFAESGNGGEARIFLDKVGNKKYVSKGSFRCKPYLSVNDEGIIGDSDTDTAVYNIMSGKKTSIAKEYKGSNNKDILYIDSQRDILYYLEKKDDVCGAIIGISKSGEIVDKWEPVGDSYFLDMLKKQEGWSYPTFSFDGNLRVFKLSAKMPDNDGNKYIDCIFTVNREGKCEERFCHKYIEENDSFFNSILHIQTPSAVVVHFKRNNKFMEHMVTLTGERIVKPLFS